MEQQTLPGFKRRRQVGFSILGFKTPGQSLYLKVMEMGVFTKTDGDTIEYADVINLSTGEENRMWLDGGLKYNFSKIYDDQGYPFSVEVRWNGKKAAEVMIDGKKKETEINDYTVWELDEETESANH